MFYNLSNLPQFLMIELNYFRIRGSEARLPDERTDEKRKETILDQKW